MRGDIEGKSPCRFQGGLLLTLFQRGSMCVQAPFTPPVFQSLRESRRVTQNAEERHADLLRGGKDPAAFAVIPCSHERCGKTTQISAIDTARSPRCGSYSSRLCGDQKEIPVAGGREPSMGGATMMLKIHLRSTFLSRSKNILPTSICSIYFTSFPCCAPRVRSRPQW